jgi:hypothetical protein
MAKTKNLDFWGRACTQAAGASHASYRLGSVAALFTTPSGFQFSALKLE